MGRIIHFEIPSDNPEKSSAFYKNTFGWNSQKWGEEDYWLTETGAKETPGINGAITKRSKNLQHVVNTIMVDNITSAISLINKNGGKVITDIMDIPNIGKFVYFKDPDENIMGALESSMQMT